MSEELKACLAAEVARMKSATDLAAENQRLRAEVEAVKFTITGDKDGWLASMRAEYERSVQDHDEAMKVWNDGCDAYRLAPDPQSARQAAAAVIRAKLAELRRYDIHDTASSRIKGDKDRENPVERPQPVAWMFVKDGCRPQILTTEPDENARKWFADTFHNEVPLCAAAEATDRLTAMKAAGDGLAEVAGGHSDECGKWWDAAENCTCGFNAALKQWKEASDGL